MTGSRLFAAVLVLGLILGAILLNSPLAVFIHLPSVLLVLGVTLGGILVSHTPAKLTGGIRGYLSRGRLDPAQADRNAALFGQLADLALASGLVGPLIGIAIILTNLDDPAKLGPPMAVCLLTMFYAVVCQLVFHSAAADCLARKEPPRKPRPSADRFAWRKVVGLGVVAGGLVVAIVLHSPPLVLLHAPSFCLVAVGTAAGIFLSHTPSDVRTVLAGFFGSRDLEEPEAQDGFALYSRLADLAVEMGLIGTLIGVVAVLQSLDDPTKVGPPMAVALLTLLYGVLLSELVFRPAASDCLVRAGVTQDPARSRRFHRIMGLIGMLNLVLLSFFVILLAIVNYGRGPYVGPVGWLDGETPDVLLPELDVVFPFGAGPSSLLEEREHACASVEGYVICTEPTPLALAKRYCESLGGAMVILETEQENRRVGGLLDRLSYRAVWVAATDREVEGQWNWPDGTKLAHDPWLVGEPDDMGEEDCASMNLHQGDPHHGGEWNDVGCEERLGVVCELDEPVRKQPAEEAPMEAEPPVAEEGKGASGEEGDQ